MRGPRRLVGLTLVFAALTGLAATGLLPKAHAQTPTPTVGAGASPTATAGPVRTATGTPGPAPSSPPVMVTPSPLADVGGVYRRLVEATERGDVSAAVALFTENATVMAPPLCAPDPCTGAAAIRREWEALAAAGLRGTILSLQVDAHPVRGTTVVAVEEHRAAPISASGVERVISRVTATFSGTKIARLHLALDLNDPQTAAYADYSAVSGLIRQLTEARNRGEATAQFFTDDATFVGGAGCPTVNPCIGGTAVQARFQQAHAQGERATLVRTQVEGSRAVFRLEVRNQTTAAAGVDRVVVDIRVELRDGRISSWRAAMDLTDEQTAIVASYNAALAAPAAMPRAGRR